MVSSHSQAIDSAFVKANASMASLELKVPKESLNEHLQKIRHISSADRPAKIDKARKKQYMKRKRHSTVEPVFGTLINYLGLRKINTLGIKQANKAMLMAAVTYNLKKYMKFTQIKNQSMAQNARNNFFLLSKDISFIIGCLMEPKKSEPIIYL